MASGHLQPSLDISCNFDDRWIVELRFQIEDFSGPLSEDHSLGNFTCPLHPSS